MSVSEAATFGKWRAFFWPIHTHELKKFLPMLAIFFLITLNYNILHTLKDTIVVYAKGSGAEAIPFVKVWAMFPGAILMTILFTRLSNHFTREQVFYIMMSIFIGYFLLYLLILYPYRDALRPDGFADYLQSILPVGFKGFIAMIRNWTASSFYAMAELWSNIVLFLLFWGFANQITQLHEAKRFYGLFGVGANLSGVAAGQFAVYISQGGYNPLLPFGTTAWEQSQILLIGFIIVAGLATLALFYWMQVKILGNSLYYHQEIQTRQNKAKFSMRDTFRFLVRSRYVLSLAVVVLCYNLVINLVEVLWKYEVKELYSDANDYNLYMNQVSSIIGLLATLASLFVSANSIRLFGWTFTALLTPAILLMTSIGFFGFFFLQEHPSIAAFLSLGVSPLAMVVFFGSAQNVLSRAAKYSVFDATKEMAFIPLDSDAKIKSKAAIDGIGCRLGKSGGALIYQLLMAFLGSLTATVPYVAGFLLTAITIWIFATYILGQQFTALTEPQEIPETSPLPFSPNIQEPQAV